MVNVLSYQKKSRITSYDTALLENIFSYTLCLGSSETVSFFLPFARLLATIFLPVTEAILLLNPCLFFLFLLDGWNVLFIFTNAYKFQTAKLVFFYRRQNNET